MTRRAAVAFGFAFVCWSLAAAVGADAASDAARAELSRERRLLASDVSRLSDVSRRLDTALSDLAAANRAAADAAARGDSPDDIVRREDAVSAAEQEVRSLLDRRRPLADRIADRRRRIALLESESQGAKPEGVLTGRWSVLVQPGDQRGVFRLNLQGTIVSGEYRLEGGMDGSVRGTLINDRLKLERVDSKNGFDAIFYGRLSPDAQQIVGTWQATTFGTGQTGSGSWTAARLEDSEQ
jgi:hypothetical protein